MRYFNCSWSKIQSEIKDIENFKRYLTGRLEGMDEEGINHESGTVSWAAENVPDPDGTNFTYQSAGDRKWALLMLGQILVPDKSYVGGGEFYPAYPESEARKFKPLPCDWWVPVSAIVSQEMLYKCMEDYLNNPLELPKSIPLWKETTEFEGWPEDEMY